MFFDLLSFALAIHTATAIDTKAVFFFLALDIVWTIENN